MIDFRYHLVSIVAVFLALTVGIVLGNAALNGPVLDGLRGSISRLTADKRTLQNDVGTLRDRVGHDDQFAGSVAAPLVAGSLAGARVVLMSTPAAPDQLVAGLLPVLAQAGATVVTRVRLRPALFEPGSRTQLAAATSQAAPPAVTLPGRSPAGDAGTELAAALFSNGRPDTALLSPVAADGVLASLSGAGLVEVTRTAAPRWGNALVLVTGGSDGPPVTDVTRQRDAAVVDLVRGATSQVKATVIVGPATSAADGSELRAARDDPVLGSTVSSVDTADTPAGGVLVVAALRELIHGQPGSYGLTGQSSAAVPSPAP